MKEADLMILRSLRQNARENLTQISKKTKIPVSTLFDRIKNLEQGIIRKYASLLDFKKIGFPIRLTLLLKCDPSIREELKRYLLVSEQVNSLMRINNGYEYLAECVFKDLDAHQRFLDQLTPFRLNFQEHFVLDDLKRETFLSEEINVAVLMR